MALTQDDLNQNQAEFNQAFSEDQPAAQEPSEDEAFGLNLDQAAEPAEQAEGEQPASVALVIADGDDMQHAAEQDQAKDSAEQATDDANADRVTPQVAGEGGDMEKEAQRLRSWEGRLKAMEAKLKEAGAKDPEEQNEALAEAMEKAADATDTPADEEKVEQIAEQVEDGKISAEQAMKQLAEDFGDDFVRMIEAIAVSKAREAGSNAAQEHIGQVNKTVEEIINDIVDTKAKAHFEQIADKHPDFNEIANSPEFAQWIENKPEGEQEEAKRVATSGSAKEINKLLDAYKASAPKEQSQGDQPMDLAAGQDDAMDAAEGVRSTGMRLPQQPDAAQDDYLGAWDKY